MGKRKLRSDDKKAPPDSTPHAPQAAILEQLQQISAQVQGLQQQMNDHVQGLRDRLDGLEKRLAATEARANADMQRVSNAQVRYIGNSETFWRGVAYVPVVKYIPGHPFQPHPNLDGVKFAQDYPVDSQPPPNLLPTNYRELSDDWCYLTPEKMSQRIRAIFWFYNDHRFQLPDNATKELCQNTLRKVLDNFLRIP